MKHIKKVICLVLALCMLFSVSGCFYNLTDDVKEAKKSHAIYTDDTHETIEFQNKKYTKYKGEISFEINDYGWGYVTSSDVPALLSNTFGSVFNYTRDMNIIEVDYSSEEVYVAEGFEQEFAKLMEEGTSKLGYYGWTVDGERESILATASLEKAITETISGAPLKDFDYDTLAHISEIYRFDSKMLIRSVAFEVLVDENDNYYLSAHYGTYAVDPQYKDEMVVLSSNYIEKYGPSEYVTSYA